MIQTFPLLFKLIAQQANLILKNCFADFFGSFLSKALFQGWRAFHSQSIANYPGEHESDSGQSLFCRVIYFKISREVFMDSLAISAGSATDSQSFQAPHPRLHPHPVPFTCHMQDMSSNLWTCKSWRSVQLGLLPSFAVPFSFASKKQPQLPSWAQAALCLLFPESSHSWLSMESLGLGSPSGDKLQLLSG